MTEVQRFLAAVQFLTRIPIGIERSRETRWLSRSAKYFPLVGLLVGVISAGVLLGAGSVWTGPLPAVLAVVAGVLVTGAMHEDGLADSADALGGTSVEQRLAVMRDSRIGTFGVLALIFTVSIRIAAISAMPPMLAVPAILCAAAGGRLADVLTMAAGRPAVLSGKTVQEKVGFTLAEILVALVFGLLPFCLAPLWIGLIGLAGGAALAAIARWRANALLGGYTGDVLGAIEQMFEVGLLLACAAAWSLR